MQKYTTEILNLSFIYKMYLLTDKFVRLSVSSALTGFSYISAQCCNNWSSGSVQATKFCFIALNVSSRLVSLPISINKIPNAHVCFTKAMLCLGLHWGENGFPFLDFFCGPLEYKREYTRTHLWTTPAQVPLMCGWRSITEPYLLSQGQDNHYILFSGQRSCQRPVVDPYWPSAEPLHPKPPPPLHCPLLQPEGKSKLS